VRSSAVLFMPRHRLNTLALRAFSLLCCRFDGLNALPNDLRHPTRSTASFRTSLKLHYSRPRLLSAVEAPRQRARKIYAWQWHWHWHWHQWQMYKLCAIQNCYTSKELPIARVSRSWPDDRWIKHDCTFNGLLWLLTPTCKIRYDKIYLP